MICINQDFKIRNNPENFHPIWFHPWEYIDVTKIGTVLCLCLNVNKPILVVLGIKRIYHMTLRLRMK